MAAMAVNGFITGNKCKNAGIGWWWDQSPGLIKHSGVPAHWSAGPAVSGGGLLDQVLVWQGALAG